MLIEKLPDELYRETISYVFYPVYELNRYKNNKLTEIKINR